MSDSSAPCRSMIDVIIPHPSAPRVLVLAEGGRWHLPRVPIDGIWAVDLGQICRELQRTLGIATTVLRLASRRGDDAQGQVCLTYVLENRTHPGSRPPTAARSLVQSLATWRSPSSARCSMPTWSKSRAERSPEQRGGQCGAPLEL